MFGRLETKSTRRVEWVTENIIIRAWSRERVRKIVHKAREAAERCLSSGWYRRDQGLTLAAEGASLGPKAWMASRSLRGIALNEEQFDDTKGQSPEQVAREDDSFQD